MQISQKISWGFYKFKATSLIALGLRQMATAQFHQMLIDFPGDIYALSSLAFLKMESGDKKGAIDDYQSIVKNSNVPAQIWYNLGFLQEEQGMVQEAEVSFLAALKMDERFDQAWYGLGLALIQQKRFDEAIKALKQNTKLQPMSPYAWYQLARVYVEREKPDEALKIIRHLKDFEPKFAKQLERETGLVTN